MHEPEQFYTVAMAHYYINRIWSDADIGVVLNKPDWPAVAADYKMAELIPLLADLWDCRFVWVTRNARSTVASMVAKGWYLPSDDEIAAVHIWWWLNPNKLWQDANYPGFRTRPDRLGHMSHEDWQAMGQPERCCWWWQHSTRLIGDYLTALPGRWWGGRLETLNASSLLEWCGVHKIQKFVVPHTDKTGAAWNPEWEPYWEKWCKALDEQLGYVE